MNAPSKSPTPLHADNMSSAGLSPRVTAIILAVSLAASAALYKLIPEPDANGEVAGLFEWPIGSTQRHRNK